MVAVRDGCRLVIAALEAATAAVANGDVVAAIGHCEVAKAQCVRLAIPTAPPPREPDQALDIAAVSALTGYSTSRLRQIGHTLPGYKKWANGKVTWSRRMLEASLPQP